VLPLQGRLEKAAALPSQGLCWLQSFASNNINSTFNNYSCIFIIIINISIHIHIGNAYYCYSFQSLSCLSKADSRKLLHCLPKACAAASPRRAVCLSKSGLPEPCPKLALSAFLRPNDGTEKLPYCRSACRHSLAFPFCDVM
jgi:hypothetical protein